jgi:hypothetical protein
VKIGDTVQVLRANKPEHQKYVGRRGRVIVCNANFVHVRFDYPFSRKRGPSVVFASANLILITLLDELAEI